MVLRQLLLLICLFCLCAVHAQRNVTVDDNDASITYSPASSWAETDLDDLNVGGRHMVTSDASATATFTFTGIAIYFYSPLWPFHVTTALSLDGNPPETVDLTDPNEPPVDDGPETVSSQVMWSRAGLENTEHTLVISVVTGENIAIVDALMYTALDTGDSTSSTSTSTAPSSSSTSHLPLPTQSSTSAGSSTTPSSKKGLSIALGLVCTTFGLLVIGAFFWYWRRRQRKREAEELEHNNLPDMSDTTPATSASRGPRAGYYSRPRALGSRYRPVTNIPPRRSGPSSTPSASSPLRHSTTSAPSATAGKVKPTRNKPLSTIPEVVAREDGWRPTSTTGPQHPDGADLRDTSPRLSLATPPWTEVGVSRVGGEITATRSP